MQARIAAPLLCVSLLFLPALAGDPRPFGELVKALGSEEVEAREAASKELVERGDGVLKELEAALGGEDAKDPEIAVRLRECVKQVNLRLEWKELWPKNPGKLAMRLVEGEKCGTCGKASFVWEAEDIVHEAITKHCPNMKVIRLNWVCCTDKPKLSRVIGVTEAPGGLLALEADGDIVAKLAGQLVPAADVKARKQQAWLARSLLTLTWPGNQLQILEENANDAALPAGGHRVDMWQGRRASGVVDFDAEGKIVAYENPWHRNR